MKKKLTVRGINALKPADSGDDRKMIWDTEVPNFGVRVTETGKISFIVMRRLGSQGVPVRRVVAEHRCGAEYTEGLLTQAREDARALIRLMAQGIDPKAKAETERAAVEREKTDQAANSFEAVAEDFIKRHVQATDKGALGSSPASRSRRRSDARSSPHGAAGSSPRSPAATSSSCSRALSTTGARRSRITCSPYLSKLFNWAIARDAYGLQASPVTRGMAKDIIGAKRPRQRVLKDFEMAEVWKASAALPSPFGAFVRMLLVTGQRLREVANAKWSEFDLEAKMWTIPAARMKGDAAHEVPLSALAVEILEFARQA